MNKYVVMGLGACAAVLLGGAGFLTNGLIKPTPGGGYTHVTPDALLPLDTNLSGGRQPQSVGAEAFRVAAMGMSMMSNQTTAVSGAATLNRRGGMVVSDALTTAPGATYVLTLTDSAILSGTTVLAEVIAGSNTAIAGLGITSLVVSTGTAVITFTNTSTGTFNGTVLVGFQLVN
jgi:hypothetical protein